MKVTISAWADGAPIPSEYAFGQIPAEGRFELGGNISPEISWSGAPDGTKSFALICHDPDVPNSLDDVNQEGKTVSKDLPRVDFFHWVLVNIPVERSSIAKGEGSEGVVPRGKAPGKKAHGTTGLSNYTDWFKGDPDMEGLYADYDGPCPPWNDELLHRYVFTVYALDVDAVETPDGFDGPAALAAIKDHVLAEASYIGTYTMNRDL